MTPNQIRLTQQLFVYHRSGFKCIRVAEVHNRITLVKGRIVESALRQSSNQRHLTAFEPQSNAPTRARLLPFMTLATRLAVSRALTATQALDAMSRSWPWSQIMKTHHVGRPFHR